MAIDVHIGSFATDGTGVNGATQTISDPGFQPTFTIFWSAGALALNTNTVSWVQHFGVGTGASGGWSLYSVDTDNVGTSVAGKANYSTASFVASNTGGDAIRLGTYTRTATGFTLTHTLNDTFARHIHYMCVGGDVNNVASGVFNMPASTGISSVVTGLSFQPDVVLLATVGHTIDNDAIETGPNISIGMAKSSSEEWVSSWMIQDNAAFGNTASYQRGDRVLSIIGTSNTITDEAEFSSMNSDGFSLNVLSTAADSKKIYYLAFSGGTHKLGQGTQATSVGQSQTSTGGVNPVGIFLTSINQTASTAVLDHARASIGAAVSTTERASTWAGARDNLTTMADDRHDSNAHVLRMMTEGTPTTDATADLHSLDTEGFTLDWETADGTAREFNYWAFGAAPDGGGGGPGSTTGNLTVLGVG